MKTNYTMLLVVICSVCIGIIQSSFVFAQEPMQEQGEFEFLKQQKSEILKEVYSNPDYISLIDIEKAEITLSDLSKSFQMISSQYDKINDQRGFVEEKYGNVQIEIDRILQNTLSTKLLINDTVTKLNLFKVKIDTNKTSIRSLQSDINSAIDDLQSYTKFLYILHNQYYARGNTLDDVNLMIQSQNVAESLSEKAMVTILTRQLHSFLDELRNKQLSLASSIQQINTARVAYNQAALSLKDDLNALDEQKDNLYELLSYLQNRKDSTGFAVSSLRESQDNLNEQIGAMKTITSSFKNTKVDEESPTAQLLAIPDKEESSRYFTWPMLNAPHISTYFHDEFYFTQNKEHFEGVRFEAEHRSEVYAAAPGIVYKVIKPETLELGWVILLHKYGFTTFYSPLNEVFVEEGDIVNRGSMLGLSGGQPGTKGAGMQSAGSRLDFLVMKNGDSVDPLDNLDISIYDYKEILPEKYHTKFTKDLLDREVNLTEFDKMKGDTLAQRRDEFLSLYASGPFSDSSLWIDAAQQTGIDPIFGMCIGFAETSYKNFKTTNNIGNVGNDDRGRTREFSSPLEGAKALFWVFNNKYLGNYNTLNELSRFGNRDGFIYASSPFNRQKNIMTCLSSIYGYRVPEDFAFRRRVR